MENIVFYDGECGLCQRTVVFLINHDHKKILRFAPLNGETYKRFFPKKSDMSTLIYWKNGSVYEKSDAVIEVLVNMGGIKKLAFLFKLIPRFIRDIAYDAVAKNRHQVSCILMPKSEQDERFLK